MTEDEMVGWYHRLDGHEFEQALGIGDGQGSLMCCSPWVHRSFPPLSLSALAKDLPHLRATLDTTVLHSQWLRFSIIDLPFHLGCALGRAWSDTSPTPPAGLRGVPRLQPEVDTTAKPTLDFWFLDHCKVL